jgi:hypothetical protein
MKSMKLIVLILTSATFLLASCATTSVTDVWKDNAYEGKAQKIVVIMVAKSPEMRTLS